MPVVPAEHEDHRHLEAAQPREVQARVFRPQRLEGEAVAPAEADQVEQSGLVGAERRPDELPGGQPATQRAAEALDPAAELQLVVHRPRRRAHGAEHVQRPLVAPLPGLPQRPGERRSLAPREVGDLRDADVGHDLLRVIAGVERAEHGAPRVAEQHHALRAEARPHAVDELVEVRDHARDRHRRSRKVGVVRPARAALLPVDDDEVLLQRGVVVPEERRLAGARPAVQEDEHRRPHVAAAEPDGLLHPAERHGLHRRDAARDDATRAVGERPGPGAGAQRQRQGGEARSPHEPAHGALTACAGRARGA